MGLGCWQTPLRRIVGEVVEHGTHFDLLECGHRMAPPKWRRTRKGRFCDECEAAADALRARTPPQGGGAAARPEPDPDPLFREERSR